MLVGRTAQLEEWDRLLDAAGQGAGGRLLVLGDPGMGTTALLSECAARARRKRAEVVLLPVADLATATLPTVAATSGATVLIVDDLDTADASASARLADLGRTPPPRLLILAGGRSTTHLPPAFAEWTQLRLDPLDIDDAVAILTDVLGSAAPPTVLYRLATRLEGNPRALREVPALLTMDERQGRAPLREHLPVPTSLDEAWGRLLDSLPDHTRSAAVDLAVVGPRADLLGAMSEEGNWSGADLDRLVDDGLVRSSPAEAPAFVHAVVRDVVLARAPTAEVRDRHRRAAVLGERLSLPPRVIVSHLEQAVPTVDEEVADHLERQARRAEALDQVTVASQAWQASARLSPTESARVARAINGLRLVITNGLDYAGTDDLLDLLAGAQLDSECCLWVEWLHTLKAVESDPDAGLAAQFTTIRRARIAAPDTLRGLIWDAAMNAWSLGDADAGLRAARDYLEAERESDDGGPRVEPPWAGAALVAAGLFQAGEVREAMHLRERAIDAARQVDPLQEPFDRLLSMVFLDDLLLDTSMESAQRLIAARQRAPERSAPLACLLGIQAWRARARGDWEGASELLARGRPLAGVTGASGAQLGMGALVVELAALTGHDDDLRREHELIRAQAQRAGDRRRLVTLDRAIGLRALSDGRFEESLVSLAAAADVPFLGRGLRDAVIPARVDLVEVHARMNDPDAALDRAASVLPVLAAMDDAAARALELRVRALLAPDDDVEALYRAALEAHAEAHDPFEEARTALLLGEHLRRDRQPAAARISLLAAERAFDALDARPWLTRTRRELHAAGGRPTAITDLACLTAQERSVAEAAASGLSTREVAARLFLSPRTVEYHLGSVYRKLGVHGRAALAGRLVSADAN